MRQLATAVLMLLTGCNLYFGGDDEPDPPCYAYGAPDIAPPQLRNPETGECQSFDSPYPCDGTCGPCPAYDATGISIALPNWAQCYSQCEALDENSCVQTPGCQAAYQSKDGWGDPDDPNGGRGQAFMGCWATLEPTVSGGACAGLDSQSCSQHDNCSMNYTTSYAPDDSNTNQFSHCSAEGGTGDFCYSDMDCEAGERCTAGYEECTSPCGPGEDCPAVCGGTCVPVQNSCANIDCGPDARCEEHCKEANGQIICEAVCVSNSSCDLIDCQPGSHCVEVCTAGDPMDPNAPGCGQCYPQCVPDDQPTACEELPSENACSSRSDCTPVYLGEDCTCYPDGCTCNILTYERCQTGMNGGGGGGGGVPPRE